MPRIACDGCDTIQPDQGLVGWIRVAPHGVDTSTYPHGFWEQERYFHSLQCLADKLASTGNVPTEGVYQRNIPGR